MTLAVGVEVLEELLAGDCLAALHDSRQAAVPDTDLVPDPALAAEVEAQGRAGDIHVAAAQGRQGC